MKHVKMLGLLAVTAAALMAFAGTASATLTSPAGTAYGGGISAQSTNFSFDGSVKISCSKSTLNATPTSAGSTTATVNIWTFSECGKDTFVVENEGTLSIDSDGTITSTGLTVTTQLHRTIIFPHISITTHCIYETSNTDIGTLTEGVSPPVHHIGSSPVPEVTTDSACGNDMVWTGSYTITTPSSAITID